MLTDSEDARQRLVDIQRQVRRRQLLTTGIGGLLLLFLLALGIRLLM